VEHAAVLLTIGHQLWTVQAATENISVCELTDHSALYLFAYLRLRNTLTYLLTYLLEMMPIYDRWV